MPYLGWYIQHDRAFISVTYDKPSITLYVGPVMGCQHCTRLYVGPGKVVDAEQSKADNFLNGCAELL